MNRTIYFTSDSLEKINSLTEQGMSFNGAVNALICGNKTKVEPSAKNTLINTDETSVNKPQSKAVDTLPQQKEEKPVKQAQKYTKQQAEKLYKEKKISMLEYLEYSA